jgi:iron(III) transport system ATP-binding protein
MNRGRIEQVGPPEEIYQQPRSEFVARFIGGTNILRGQPDNGAVRCGPLVIQCGNPVPNDVDETPVSIRPNDIQMGAAGEGPNRFNATVLRHTYLGAQRDYLLELPGGATLRATTPLRTLAEIGSTVGVHLPPEQCRALPC